MKQMEMVLYRTEDDSVTVSAIIKDESIWITKKQWQSYLVLTNRELADICLRFLKRVN